MTRIILCPVGGKPRMTEVVADLGGCHEAALERLLGTLVVRLPMHDGVELCCDRDGLLLGLALARRALAASQVVAGQQDRVAACNGWNPHLDIGEWYVSGAFMLGRFSAGGELEDLTMADVRFWMFWLGLDYCMNH